MRYHFRVAKGFAELGLTGAALATAAGGGAGGGAGAVAAVCGSASVFLWLVSPVDFGLLGVSACRAGVAGAGTGASADASAAAAAEGSAAGVFKATLRGGATVTSGADAAIEAAKRGVSGPRNQRHPA